MHNLGYACIPAWASVLFACMALLPDVSTPVDLSLMQMACPAVMSLVALLFALVAGRLAPLSMRHGLVYLAGVVGAAGTCCVALAGSGVLPASSLPAGYAVVGLGNGVLTCAWMERLARQSRATAALTLVVCTPLGYLACLLVDVLPFQAAIPVAAALPVMAALLVPVGVGSAANAEGSQATAPQGDAPFVASLSESAAHAPWRLFAVVLLVNIAYGLVRASGVVGGAYSSGLVGAALQGLYDFAGVGIGVYLAVRAWKIRTAPAFYPVFAFIALGGLLLSDTAVNADAAASAISYIGVTLITTLGFFLIMDAAGAGKISALFGVCLLKACEMGGVMLGQLCVELFVARGVVAVAVLIVLLVAAFVVMGASDAFSIAGETSREAGMGSGQPAPSADELRRARIAQIAREYGLSSRESQILELWGTGHTSSFIEQELSISKNTVKTHLGHIYSKTGVASKDELLSLVEERTSPQG